MWRTLQQDFSEFVAVVAKDSKEVLSAVMQAQDEDDNGSSSSHKTMTTTAGGLSAMDTDLLRLQHDPRTFTEAVNEADKEQWVSFVGGLDLSSKETEMASLLKENEDVARLHAKLVRNEEEENDEGDKLDTETFWLRYFFRLERLVRQKRGVTLPLALAGEDDDEEDLSWGDDEDEDEEKKLETEKPNIKEQMVDPVVATAAAVLAVVRAEKEHRKEEQQAASTPECGSPSTIISLPQSDDHDDTTTMPEPVPLREEVAAGDLNANESTSATAVAADLARMQDVITIYKTRTHEMEVELMGWKKRCSVLEGQLEKAQTKEKETTALATDSIAELRAEQMEHQQLQQQHEELKMQHSQLQQLSQEREQEQLPPSQSPQLEKSLTQINAVKGIEREEEEGEEESGEELKAWS
jgi:hypothetical protein